MTEWRIKLLAMPARNGCEPLPEAYYGDVPGVSMNHLYYSRVQREKAFTFTRPEDVIHVINNRFGSNYAKAEPPITVTY